jgi:AcrR family transcriptional regulator
VAETATTIPGTDQHKRAQRERILAAAQKRFICSGFHSASMATIAETAGMSPGLIYRYFANKNAIILAIIEQQLKIAQRRIRDMRSTDGASTQAALDLSRWVPFGRRAEVGDNLAVSSSPEIPIALAWRDSPFRRGWAFISHTPRSGTLGAVSVWRHGRCGR